MAICTKTIQDTINWSKRFAFNRNPVIGNSLEPAVTSAQMVMQVLLSPPFEWWWNNEELVFTANPVPNAATSTAVSITSGVVTVTATNTFVVGNLVLPKNLATLTGLNGLLLEVATASSSQFTALVPTLGNGSDTVGVFTNITTQDYPVATPEFSHIEHASVLDLDSTGKPTKWYELTVKNNLSLETETGRPEFLSPHSEDGNGSTTFRLSCAPDKTYPVSVHIQKAAPAFTNGVNSLWAPLPDFMQYIYNWGFLALMWQFADDPRATYANNKFTAGVLARADGLTDEQKNIFLNNWEELRFGSGQMKQQGIAARGQ